MVPNIGVFPYSLYFLHDIQGYIILNPHMLIRLLDTGGIFDTIRRVLTNIPQKNHSYCVKVVLK